MRRFVADLPTTLVNRGAAAYCLKAQQERLPRRELHALGRAREAASRIALMCQITAFRAEIAATAQVAGGDGLLASRGSEQFVVVVAGRPGDLPGRLY